MLKKELARETAFVTGRRLEAKVLMCVGIIVMGGCTATTKISNEGPVMKYMVNRFEGDMVLDGNWEGPAWSDVKPIALSYFMGNRPEHFPRTQAKLLYDDKFIHVIFRVEDRYVRAVAQKHQGMVCRDSCVEFFFTPGTDVKAGYFNLEMNCGGTMLFHCQVIPRKGREIEAADLARIEIAHQMPKIVDPEITKPTTWTVQYRLPIDILEKYYPGAKKPRSGISWRANFFKCADATSHPHWLTWSKVDRPKPDFHVPECFGILEFK